VGLLPTLEAMLAGDAALLPVSAFDAREKSLLTTALGVGSEIDDDVALVFRHRGRRFSARDDEQIRSTRAADSRVVDG